MENPEEKVMQVVEKIHKTCDKIPKACHVALYSRNEQPTSGEVPKLMNVGKSALKRGDIVNVAGAGQSLKSFTTDIARREKNYKQPFRKVKHLKRLWKEADSDAGRGVQAVKASIKDKRSPPITNPDLQRNIVSTSFPQVPSKLNLPTVQVNPGEIPEVTTEEVLDVAKKITENKTQGLDDIPNKALLVTITTVPNWLAQMFPTSSTKGLSRKSERTEARANSEGK